MVNNHYFSPSYGTLTLDEVRSKTLKFIQEFPEYKYQMVIGTDSKPANGKGIDFVTAIVIHRQGVGGIYFWKRLVESKSLVLRNRIYQEAVLSLNCAQEVLEAFKNDGFNKFNVEIHVDVGKFGDTRTMLTEVVGMIRGSGFLVKTKPEAYAASNVADRHT
ncbi:hypothetical protein A2960_06035 [Candidatus Gottesmanbacteria bacterium RIFCSPLOWO2_01_FULL_39_12b]|uniref:DUF458 domain-containing protein n=1 Tax=Candidatus Gottesmanbacteria bacterium RIFCSPLOWO2_01_FULL_39_12b TaxID=1798388 RepID=A0A1F6AP56_9BACT|nr:MAG: hypothetical protein A2960_06035 [Candidatus Gottesmanbacteria bacterium RIFCSPLOWO2_01_FULL_39_12b]